MKPHSDCFNAKLNHTSDLEKLLGEHATTKRENHYTFSIIISKKSTILNQQKAELGEFVPKNLVICSKSPKQYAQFCHM